MSVNVDGMHLPDSLTNATFLQKTRSDGQALWNDPT